MMNRIAFHERRNDEIRSLIDVFITVCAAWFRFVLFVRLKTYRWNQAHLRKKYGIEKDTKVHDYDEATRASIEDRARKLGSRAVYACTSGSTQQPKKVFYNAARLRRTRQLLLSTFFRYLSRFQGHRTLYIFSAFAPDQTLTTFLLKENGLPPYISGLQAPHRVANHPAIRESAAHYGEPAVHLWLLVISNPVLVYATNPSTLATFFHEINSNWPTCRRLILDYVNNTTGGSLNNIHRRIASAGSMQRLNAVAASETPLPIRTLLPALRGFSCWDGGYVAPFLDQIRKILPESQYRKCPMLSMSTETIETVAGLQNDAPSFVPLAPGVLYEFVEDGLEDHPENLIAPELLVPGKLYSMIVSDAYGLRRYQTEDLFLCAGSVSGIPDLRFSRRRNLSYSFTGEKLTADQLRIAYDEVESQFPEVRLNGFLTCFPSTCPAPSYRLIFVRTGRALSASGAAIASIVEKKLGEINREYKAKRESRRLGEMTFQAVPIREFVSKTTGAAAGSQFKFLPLVPKLWEA